MVWSRRFDKPILLADGSLLITLTDARQLPVMSKARHSDVDVVTAIEAVLMAGEGRGPPLNDRIAIHRHGPRNIPEPEPSKERMQMGAEQVGL